MEVVGIIASFIAIVEVAKKLNDAVVSVVGKVPKSKTNPTTISGRILRDLEAMQDSLSAGIGLVPVEAGQELRDACSALELSLRGFLNICSTANMYFDGNIWDRFKVVARGKRTRFNVIDNLKQIEKEVLDLHRRFSMTGIIRIELATTQALALMEQFHSEIHQRLDFIEDHLNVQVAKANANPAFAETLVGTSRMTEVVVKASLKQASMDLENSSAGLEAKYLRFKVQTLAEALQQFPPEHLLGGDQGPQEEGGDAHHYPTDDPSQQTEDVILECVKLLRILRAGDQSSMPFLDIVVSLEHLANQMLDLGMYEDARQTYRQVVCIYRACIQESSPASELDARVARAIIGLCAALQRLGKPEEALNLIKDAVLVFRFLNEQSPLNNYKAELAVALNNMANYMRDSGAISGALPIIDEAVKSREELAWTKPDLYKPDLVVSLLNSSTCHSKFPYLHEQALNLAEKAVNISRELVLEVPGKYAAHLGATLHNRANRRMVLWRNQEAYLDIQEAVEIRRKLAASRPDVFGGGLIRSLSVAKALAIRCKDETGASALSEELQWRCKDIPGSDDIPIIRSPTVSVPFRNPHQEFGLARYYSWQDTTRRKILYHGSGNLETPHVINTPNTAIDQVISPGSRRRR